MKVNGEVDQRFTYEGERGDSSLLYCTYEGEQGGTVDHCLAYEGEKVA